MSLNTNLKKTKVTKFFSLFFELWDDKVTKYYDVDCSTEEFCDYLRKSI